MPDGAGRAETMDSSNIDSLNQIGTVLVADPVELARAFANTVTIPSDSPNDFVARNGDQSIFSVLWSILPEVTWIRSFYLFKRLLD